MATLPTTEFILFEAYRAAGLNILPGCGGQKLGTPQKDRFVKRNLSLDVYQQRYQELFLDLLRALGSESDKELNDDLFRSLCEFHAMTSHLERGVWTYGASENQVSWTVLSFCYVPWIARKAAFWRQEIELTKDIPGGVFWYLPQPSSVEANTLELPVAQVCRWLLTRLGIDNAYGISELEAKNRANGSDTNDVQDKKEALQRSLYNWLSGEVSISAKAINHYFADDPDLKLEIRDKNGSPITFRTIRQKLLYARLVQETYIKLVDQLCPETDYRCADSAKNKVLQLIKLYKQIYQWTKDSYEGEQTQYSKAEHTLADHSFIAQIQQHPRAFELNVFDTANGLADTNFTVELITEVLKKQSDTDVLRDIEPWNEASLERIVESSQRLKDAVLGRRTETETLWYHIAHSSAKQAIQTSKSPSALLSLFNSDDIPWKIKQAALKRLDNLKLSDWDQIHRINVELSLYLNNHTQKNKKETQEQVSRLLNQASNHSKSEAFKAVILQFQAKHLLSQNRLKEAVLLFEQALDACSENGCGPLKGEIARDVLSISLVDQNLGKKHEKWFRTVFFENTFTSNELPNLGRIDLMERELMHRQPPTFEDTAAQCGEFFWNTLYRPYAGIQKLAPGLEEQGSAFTQLVKMIFAEDWQGFRAWIKSNPELAKKRFRDVRGQTLLIMLINMRHCTAETTEKATRIGLCPNLEPESALRRFDEAIRILIEELPKKSVNINDYKQQSPLMLAANEYLPDIVAMLINKGANLNQQDFKGRTALHAAAAAGSDACFSLLVEAGAAPEKTTIDGMTVLHTATRCGRPRMVKMLIGTFPSLASVRDHYGKLPKDYLGINKLKKWAEFAKEHEREMGSDADYLEISKILVRAAEEMLPC